MERSRKILVFFLILGLVGFGYSQYASASQIGVTVLQSELVDGVGPESRYSIQLQLDNPSLLYLTSGETEFTVSVDGQNVGYGTLVPFTLPSLSTTYVEGTFQTSKQVESDGSPVVKISGATQYDMVVTSVDIPFVFYPTEDQAREFIHQG